MRRIDSLLLSLLALTWVGCDSDECILDTDCADFQLICIEGQCLLPGTVPDGGAVDGATVAPDASTPDGGAVDAGQDSAVLDAALPDGALPDGAASDASDLTARCLDLSGEWLIEDASLDCGRLTGSATFAASDSARCQFTSSTRNLVVDVDPSGAITGTGSALSGPEETLADCTGMASATEMMITCGGCALSFSR